MLFKIGKYKARSTYQGWDMESPLIIAGTIYEIYSIEEQVIWVTNIAKSIAVGLTEIQAYTIFNPLCPMATIKRRLPAWF